MKTSSHPNIVAYLTSFVHEAELFVVMELMEGGSISDIMRYKFPDGLGNNEELIATILKQVLLGINYFHKNGQIHRDIKAGNILVSSEGHIRIGDFGVSAHLIESGDRKKARQTFVGTPCWMAPEVMEQLHGYDYKADIWSFGITAMELANGAAPLADCEPIKVMYLTLERPPPRLEDNAHVKFSKLFKEMVEQCLQRDPKLRPDSAALLKHKFFAKVKSDPQFILDHLITGVPSLGDRIRHYKEQLAEYDRQVMLYQQEQAALESSHHGYSNGGSFATNNGGGGGSSSGQSTPTHKSTQKQQSPDNNSSGKKKRTDQDPFSPDGVQQFTFDDDLNGGGGGGGESEGDSLNQQQAQQQQQQEGELIDMESTPSHDDGKPSSGWDWEEKLNITKDTTQLQEASSPQQQQQQNNQPNRDNSALSPPPKSRDITFETPSSATTTPDKMTITTQQASTNEGNNSAQNSPIGVNSPQSVQHTATTAMNGQATTGNSVSRTISRTGSRPIVITDVDTMPHSVSSSSQESSPSSSRSYEIPKGHFMAAANSRARSPSSPTRHFLTQQQMQLHQQQQQQDTSNLASDSATTSSKIGRFEVGFIPKERSTLSNTVTPVTSPTLESAGQPEKYAHGNTTTERTDFEVTSKGRTIEITNYASTKTSGQTTSVNTPVGNGTTIGGSTQQQLPPTNVDEKIRNKLTQPKTEPTLLTLQAQINQLNQSSAQQLRLLNAILQSAEKSNNMAVMAKHRETSELPSLVLQLESQIRDLLDENTRVKKENEVLRMEIETLNKEPMYNSQ